MPISTRQTSLLVAEDWTKIYQSFKNANFQSYDFETIRKAMIDYLRKYYPEDFNDYTESSEYIALIDLIATLGQSLAYRNDLNTRENFIDTAERRESILRLARLISYTPKRSNPASGILKITEVSTTELLYDSNGVDISNTRVLFNDGNNPNWQEQFSIILNAAFSSGQKIGQPGSSNIITGIKTDEYAINVVNDTLPIFPYSNVVDGVQENFEITSVTTAGKEYWYEKAPKINQEFNILYRNDNLGNSSINTGFFMHFKQGTLSSIEFDVVESIPNRVVNINIANINQTDVWLYELDADGNEGTEWAKVPAIHGNNIAYNSISANNRKIFQITTNHDDSINLVFGDGVFADIPRGKFRLYYRVSNGKGYKITPQEMPSVVLPIEYTSRSGRPETLTLVGSLEYTVTNASPRETVEDIKQRAPQRFYTQNRMVNGEDYNVFPFTEFNNIIKSKAVNRTSSGISRFLDVLDTTGKYSSTNIFCQDGLLYREDYTESFNFEFTYTNDILDIIRRRILPLVRSQEIKHLYFSKFDRIAPPPSGMVWERVTESSNKSTGYFTDSSGNIIQVGSVVGTSAMHVVPNAIIKFVPPPGFYFDAARTIKPLPSRDLTDDESIELFTTVVKVTGDGAAQGNGVLPDGTGPIVLADTVPIGAIVEEIIPVFKQEWPALFEQDVISNITLYKNFAVRYDHLTHEWAIIDSADVDSTSEFSLANAGDTSQQNLDASWLFNFVTDGMRYFVYHRGIRYIFESVLETRFYFDKDLKIFDPKTGTIINDTIKILKVNPEPDSANPLGKNISLYVYDNIVDVDGYEDNRKIKVTYADKDSDGNPDNPDFFDFVVAPETNSNSKFVFFEKTTDNNSFEQLVPVDNALIVTDYQTWALINANIRIYSVGQLFYATAEGTFWRLDMVNNLRTLTQVDNYVAKVGRQDLYFQYRHNSPNDRRIDPSPNNIIDLYILTRQYETDYKNWVLDITGTIEEPPLPTPEELRAEFGSLADYKVTSDSLIFNSARFKPLFGKEADPKLQAVFKVVKNANVNTSDSQIKSKLVDAINRFFDINNWDFGDTFYFTELSTYLHQEMLPDVASIIIVSKDGSNSFGSLFQINSEPDEILTSAATVEDIEIISAITAAQLQFNPGV